MMLLLQLLGFFLAERHVIIIVVVFVRWWAFIEKLWRARIFWDSECHACDVIFLMAEAHTSSALSREPARVDDEREREERVLLIAGRSRLFYVVRELD